MHERRGGVGALWVGVVVLVSLLSGSAWGADSLSGTRSDQLSERPLAAELTLYPDHGELVVRRAIWNAGTESDQAELQLDLPPGAVATRLRSRGTSGANPPWFEGELLEAEQAAAKYRELTGYGGHYPKDPALLSWRDLGSLVLQVFPCPPHTEKIVEYTLELPTEYARGAFRLALPRIGTPGLAARVQLIAGEPNGRLLVDGKPFQSGAMLPQASDNALELALVKALPMLEATLVTVPTDGNHVLTRYALRTAPRLSNLPKQPFVVILLDASRSTEPAFEQASKAAIDAYLSHLPDAHVQILTFDRRVTAELNGFRDTDTARLALRSLTLGRRNGSDVDQALFRADQLLAATPALAPRRVVVLTDGLTRSTLSPERLRGAVAASGALVHIGLMEEDGDFLERIDDHVWAEAVRTTGGLVWRAGAPASANLSSEERGELERVYEEWARPLRIDRVSAFSSNVGLAERLSMPSLAEGEQSADLYLDDVATQELNVSGELWSLPVRVTTKPASSPAQLRLWSALVFGSGALFALSEPEQMFLALKGRAVSPVTSYLAIEPGVRPSREGLTDEQRSHRTASPRVRMGGTKVGGRAPQIDRAAFLKDRLGPELARCGGKPGDASLELESTKDEIVRVVPNWNLDPVDALVASCLTEAVWALLLPPGFDEPWESFQIEL